MLTHPTIEKNNIPNLRYSMKTSAYNDNSSKTIYFSW